MSVHASVPAAFDQSLLVFVAAHVEATKIIEFDREVEKATLNKDIIGLRINILDDSRVTFTNL